MQNKVSLAQIEKKKFFQRELNKEKKVDVNVLLNRVKIEKKSEIKKNLIITAGAISTLAITGLISFL
tara:strand:+ start:511 stop:711 length:201 start_codon:yes stop_codon:yes gene_type:complete